MTNFINLEWVRHDNSSIGSLERLRLSQFMFHIDHAKHTIWSICFHHKCSGTVKCVTAYPNPQRTSQSWPGNTGGTNNVREKGIWCFFPVAASHVAVTKVPQERISEQLERIWTKKTPSKKNNTSGNYLDWAGILRNSAILCYVFWVRNNMSVSCI